MFALALIIGVVVCFFGRKLLGPICFLAGVILTICIVLLIFYSTFLKSTTEDWAVWVVLACSAVLGLLVGFILAKMKKLGGAALAGWGGFCLALLIWNTFLYLTTTSDALFWSFTIGIAVLCGLLTLVLFDHVIINATSMIGSFMMMAGIGIVAGGYQNPFTISEVI